MIHETALVEEDVLLGPGTSVWMNVQVRKGARIGSRCVIAKGVYIGLDVTLGDHCKIQNNASLFKGVTLGSGVFVGPHVCFTNDKVPRAVNPDLSLKSADHWQVSETAVGDGAAIGAGSVILPGLRIGEWAMVAAGSTVTRDVPPHTLVMGCPARPVARVCRCGRRYPLNEPNAACEDCGWQQEEPT